MNEIKKNKVIILGGGFAAFQIIKNLPSKYYEITVISPRDHFLFTPLLASTTVGTTEFMSIVEPLRNAQSNINFYKADCQSINTEQKKIVCKVDHNDSIFSIDYDILIIAVGAVSQTFNIPGVEKYALMIKELADARKIRHKIISCVEKANLPDISDLERKNLLHFVIVGGGPTGVEFAGELHDFISEDLIKLFPKLKDFFQITLLEASDVLLSSFSKSLSQYASKHFKRKNISVQTASIVKEVRENELILADDSIINFGALVWSTGVGPTKVVRECNLEKDQRGRIITNQFLQTCNSDTIYAIGDCAAVKGQNYPMTGQLAQQQGKYLANSLKKLAQARAIKPFKYLHLGMLAYIGGQRALADTPGVRWRGFIAWLMWRSIYLTKLVSFRNKIRVLFDWVKTSLFGRDTSSF